MKRFLILALILLALPALGDVTTSVVFTDAQAAKVTRAMNRTNREVCLYFGQAPGCTQASVRREFCRRNGIGGQPILDADGNQTGTTPLVADCPGANQFDIHSSLDQYLKREMLRLIKEQYAAAEEAEDKAAAKAAFDAKTTAEKDAICGSLGLAAGCSPF